MGNAAATEELAAKEKTDINLAALELPLLASGVTSETSAEIFSDCRILQQVESKNSLEEGKTVFFFTCAVGHTIDDDVLKKEIDSIVNLSSFDDEVKENGVPTINIFDDTDAMQYTMMVTKFAAIVPFKDMDMLDSSFLASYDYVRATTPSSVKVIKSGEDGWIAPDENTLRVCQPILAMVISITLQQKITELKDYKPAIGPPDFEWDRVYLMERTKRNINNRDSTAKTKSLLLCKQVEGGVLFYSTCIFCNTMIPEMIANGINAGKQAAAGQILEQISLLREYWRQRHHEVAI